jgi:hypothetical protein
MGYLPDSSFEVDATVPTHDFVPIAFDAFLLRPVPHRPTCRANSTTVVPARPWGVDAFGVAHSPPEVLRPWGAAHDDEREEEEAAEVAWKNSVDREWSRGSGPVGDGPDASTQLPRP